jgi:hypothetical protein
MAKGLIHILMDRSNPSLGVMQQQKYHCESLCRWPQVKGLVTILDVMKPFSGLLFVSPFKRGRGSITRWYGYQTIEGKAQEVQDLFHLVLLYFLSSLAFACNREVTTQELVHPHFLRNRGIIQPS